MVKMKPSWNDAPDWAKYLAQDFNGDWYWFENEPQTDSDWREWECADGNCEIAFTTKNEKWFTTLEARP